jgi:predicted RNA-binding protein Jag
MKLEKVERVTKNPREAREEIRKEFKSTECHIDEIEQDDGTYLVIGYPKEAMLDMLYGLCELILRPLDRTITFSIKPSSNFEEFSVVCHSRNVGLFIGKHGQNLDAIETVVCAIFNRQFAKKKTISLDIDDYKRKRQHYLISLVKKIIRQIESDHRERPVPHLLPKERRIIHSYLTDHPYLTTESRGQGNARTLFIRPRRSDKS